MTIYIASSWKNRHAVEMLTKFLRLEGYTVRNFVEVKSNYDKGSFDEWIWSENGKTCFNHDIDAAITSDLVIYIGPSGADTWAQVGCAYAMQVPILGLISKDEPSGLMRRMVDSWFTNFTDLMETIYNDY